MTHIGYFVDSEGEEIPRMWNYDGLWLKHKSENDLINIKEKKSTWVNIYKHALFAGSHSTKEEADSNGRDNRIACIKVEYQEGDGL